LQASKVLAKYQSGATCRTAGVLVVRAATKAMQLHGDIISHESNAAAWKRHQPRKQCSCMETPSATKAMQQHVNIIRAGADGADILHHAVWHDAN
jgi:hypothetical protein